MAKKSFKLVKASAALAVTAAALTPVMAAEASTAKAVELKAEVVLGGKFKEALALNTPAGVQITWGKHLVTAINKWQTVTGKGSDGKTYIKKLYARNYPLYVLDQDLGEVEAGSELVKPSIRVMYRDGKVYTQAPERYTMSSNYNTKDEGEQKVLISYNHNGNRVTKMLSYTVVAGEVEFANVASSVDQAAEILSVTADVKNLKEGEKVELVVYPGKDTSATPIKETATVKEGKLTVSKKLPAGTHSFQLVSGDVKSEIKEFTVEAPMVKNVVAANAKELVITFNKEVKKDSVITGDVLVPHVVFLNSVDVSGTKAYLSNDGKSLTLVAGDGITWNGSYAFEVAKDKVEAVVSGQKVQEYKAFVSASDTVRPTFSGVSYEANGDAKFSFSEPLNETAATIAGKLVVSGPTSVSVAASDITLAADGKSFSVVLPSSMTKDAAYTFTLTGIKDFAGNLLNPNPVSASVVKSERDTVKPTITNVVALDAQKLQVTFSEKIQLATAKLTVGNATYPTYTLDSTGTVATFSSVTNLTAGVQSVTITDALDLAGLKMDPVTRVIQVVADQTAPAYVSHAVETVGSDRFLVVNYNEEITANNAVSITGTYVDANSITQTVTAITGSAITTGTDKKSVRVKLPATAGAYTLNLPVGLAKDTSAQTNSSVARSVSFTLGAAVDSTKPVLETFAQAGNKVTVTFDRPVTAATALNVSNYSIDGISSAFESAIFKGDAKTVELTLKADVITTNGLRNYSVSNIATSAGSIMDAKTDKYEFKENVRPTVTGAKVISATQIEVTLSEALKAATVGNDFDVFQGASTTALVDAETLSGTNKVIITVSALQSLEGLTLKASAGIDLADINGNVVNFTGPIAITN